MCNHMVVRNCFFCHALAKTSLQGKFTLSLKTDEEKLTCGRKKSNNTANVFKMISTVER